MRIQTKSAAQNPSIAKIKHQNINRNSITANLKKRIDILNSSLQGIENFYNPNIGIQQSYHRIIYN